MKNLVMTGYQGYKKVSQVDNLIESYLNVKTNKDELVVLYSGDKTEINEYLDEKGITNLKMREHSTSPYLNRFKWYSQMARSADTKNAIAVDIRDVIFQSNPFEWMDKNLKKQIVFQDEGVDHTEYWNNLMVKTAFPDEYKNILNKNVYNVGVVGGNPERLAKTFSDVYHKSEKCHTPIKPSFNLIQDQGAFNLLCHTTELRAFIQPENQNSSFCYTAGVANTAFMKLENGILKNKDGEAFCIVHQYERQYEKHGTGLYYLKDRNQMGCVVEKGKDECYINMNFIMPENVDYTKEIDFN